MSLSEMTQVELEQCFQRRCPVREHYFREAIRRTKLETALKHLREENAVYREAMGDLVSQINELLSPDHAAMNLLRHSIVYLKKVQTVHFFVTGNVINIRIGITEEDHKTEMKIAEALSVLFSIFNNLRFDFLILPLDRVDLKEALPPNAKAVLSRKARQEL